MGADVLRAAHSEDVVPPILHHCQLARAIHDAHLGLETLNISEYQMATSLIPDPLNSQWEIILFVIFNYSDRQSSEQCNFNVVGPF